MSSMLLKYSYLARTLCPHAHILPPPKTRDKVRKWDNGYIINSFKAIFCVDSGGTILNHDIRKEIRCLKNITCKV